MRRHSKPILTLVLLTPVLTELLSGNLPPAVFFNPLVFLMLATIGYGFPVLLLRELACRQRVGVGGLLCLGLVYGIINEGILAKTFYLQTGVPIALYDNYGYVAGMAVPWALTIDTWHAFHSLLYPILLVHWFYPREQDEPWLSRGWAIGLAVPVGAVLTLAFFGHSKQRGPGNAPHYALMVALMAGLAWLATKLPRRPLLTTDPVFRRRALGWGAVAFGLLFLAPLLLARFRIPPGAFVGYYVVAAALVLRWLLRRAELPLATAVLFACGDDMVFLLFGLLVAVSHGALAKAAALAVLLVGFGILLERMSGARKGSVL